MGVPEIPCSKLLPNPLTHSKLPTQLLTPDKENVAKRCRVLVLNRSYWPDVEATGQLLAELGTDLVDEGFAVTVVAGEPNVATSNSSFAAAGTHEIDGVTVIRVPTRKFSKTSLWSRARGLLSYFVRTAWVATTASRPDVIIVETDPPFLPALGSILSFRHRCRLICYLQDLHPEVGLALGKFRPGILTWLLRVFSQFGLRHADRIVVLGDDMKRRVLARGVPEAKITVIPNWADSSLLRPGLPSESLRRQWDVSGNLVVMYSGNLGMSQNLNVVLDAAAKLRDEPVRFVFVGDGAHKQALEDRAKAEQLVNVRFLPYQPKDRLAESLGAADVHLITLQKGVSGFIVPSKLYGILAVGRPYIAAIDAEGDTAAVTERNNCGLRVDPDSPDQLTSAIRWCLSNRDELVKMGQRGRQVAENEFDRSVCTGKFATVLREVTELDNQTEMKLLPTPTRAV
jgi:colanic acid biosynthesis glycosyl transferase WcaI